MLSRPDGPSGGLTHSEQLRGKRGAADPRGGFLEQVELVVMDHDDNNILRVELTHFDGLERREEVVAYGYSDRCDYL